MAAVIVCLVLLGGTRGQRSSRLTAVPTGLAAAMDSLGSAHSVGSDASPVHVTEFVDYQCAACSTIHSATWPQLSARLRDGTARYTAYDVPLPIHSNAIPAAVVAGCVADADPRLYWEFRHALFERQKEWENSYPAEPLLLRIAAEVGADSAAARACVTSQGGDRARALRTGSDLAASKGVMSVPTWAVNGRVVPYTELDAAIRAVLKTAR
jgi:protein-disulfide isomerase